MLHILAEIQALRSEGKLHRKLLIRTRILFVIGAVLLGITGYNVLFREASALFVLALFIAGFALGFAIFTRMSVVQWNEEREAVEAGRMDKLGYITLALYIAFEIGLRTFLQYEFPISATAYLLSGIAGTLLGRAVGTLVEIHRVYASSHVTGQ